MPTRREVLEQRKRELEEKLKETVEFNKSAWAEYGSELSAGSLGHEVDRWRSKVRHVETLLKMPETDMDSEAIAARIQEEAEEIARVEEQIRVLQVLIERLQYDVVDKQIRARFLKELAEMPLHQ